jgi:hypothetical protein
MPGSAMFALASDVGCGSRADGCSVVPPFLNHGGEMLCRRARLVAPVRRARQYPPSWAVDRGTAWLYTAALTW